MLFHKYTEQTHSIGPAINGDGKSNAMCCDITLVASGLKPILRYVLLDSLFIIKIFVF